MQQETIVIQITRDVMQKVRTIRIADEHFEEFMRLMDAGAKSTGKKVAFEEFTPEA